MDNRQLRNLGLILILPLVFASVGYFGMKMFLSGTGPKTVKPEARPSTEASAPAENGSTIITESSNQQAVKASDNTQSNDQASNEKKTDSPVEKTEENSSSNQVSNETSNVVGNETESETTSSETSSEESASTTETVVTSKKLAFEFPSVNFFSLQVGSYSSRSNADKHVEALGEEDIDAYVFEGNNYKVMAGISPTRDGVDAIKVNVAKAVPDAFVKGMVIVPDTLKYDEGNKGDSEAFDAIVKQYKARLDGHVALISSLESKTDDEIRAYLEADSQAIVSLTASIDAYSGSDDFETVLKRISEMLSYENEKVRQLINENKSSRAVFSSYMKELLSYNRIN